MKILGAASLDASNWTFGGVMRSRLSIIAASAATAATLACLLSASHAVAQGAAASAIQPRGKLIEHYTPLAQISGTILAGVIYGGPAHDDDSPLHASIPEAWQGHLICVRIVSADGRYTASQSYDVDTSWPGGPAALPFESQLREKIADLKPEDMAVAVSKDGCEPGSELVVAGWKSRPQPDSVLLLINSFGADEAYVFIGEDPVDVGCGRADGSSRLAFDFVCSVPRMALEGQGTVRIEINRVRGGNFDEPEVVEIARVAR